MTTFWRSVAVAQCGQSWSLHCHSVSDPYLSTRTTGYCYSQGGSKWGTLNMPRQGLTRGPTHMEQMAPHSRVTSTDATGARHGSDHTNTRRPCQHS